MRERREALGLAQEKVGVAIGLDESSARARISRYELGVHEPPFATVKLLADVLEVPHPICIARNKTLQTYCWRCTKFRARHVNTRSGH
ncbi:helix-turn-helix transcriptional regulator [Limnohabitans sp.]|uniref:helix-turn-helix domain-containing protein n=1 Tax=Limnohabitans sp. TaxID=1907725 RepID=UPI003457A252